MSMKMKKNKFLIVMTIILCVKNPFKNMNIQQTMKLFLKKQFFVLMNVIKMQKNRLFRDNIFVSRVVSTQFKKMICDLFILKAL